MTLPDPRAGDTAAYDRHCEEQQGEPERVYTLACPLLRFPVIAMGSFPAMLRMLRAEWPTLSLSQKDTVTIHGPNLADGDDDDLDDSQREQLEQALAELDDDGRRA